MYHLFERFGIELEYMIVDRNTLKVFPVADQVLSKVNGSITNEVSRGEISWSNELVLHVIELKTTDPAVTIERLDGQFQKNVHEINELLLPMSGMLMPGPMHPLMDPIREMHLWPHDYNPIYEAFDRIFSCKGHGWANLQSMHINLPFANDEEFGRLHAAIRLVLPIIPALAAGSPIASGVKTGYHDTRMEVYRTNSKKIPSITAGVIPEPIFTPSEYEEKILKRIYSDLAPYDPEGILQEEWVNARGAIARFERNTIELRVIDIQEAPFIDVAIAAAVIGLTRMLANETICSYEDQKRFATDPLKEIFLSTIKDGEHAVIADREYLELLGIPGESCRAGKIWEYLTDKMSVHERAWIEPHLSTLRKLISKGTLATRILRALNSHSESAVISAVYRDLCGCLAQAEFFN